MSALSLSVRSDGLAVLTFDLPDKAVNVFTRGVMEELAAQIAELAGNQEIRCLVLLSGKKRNFIAGADVDEIAGVTDPIEAERGSRQGHELFSAWEALPFPTIAAVRGTCVGGGCEIALASSWVLISDRDDIRIGLPEVRLGIVPGWGGCTRLTRKVGLEAALDVILAGKALHPKKAFRIGLADALLPEASFLDEVRRFAEEHMAGTRPRSAGHGSGLRSLLLERNPLGRKVVFDQARKQVLARTGGHYPAPLRAIEVVRTGIEKGARAGFDAEARAIGELAVSRVAKNLIHLFRLMEAAKKNGAGDAGDEAPLDTIGVLGAGVMGGGIAHLVADQAGLPVRMKDIAAEQLASGMEHASALFARQVKRRRLSRAEAARRIRLLRPTLDYSGFERVDLVVEAVVENLAVKHKVFAELEQEVREDAVLASNTSSISIDLIGEGVSRPERLVGMHFFNPVHKMPLVEVIRGSATSDRAAQAVAELARRLGKTPVVVKDGPGFLVNRLLGFTLAEAMWLLDEGYPIEQVDREVEAWGMPMGPFTLTDEVGIDVGIKVAHILAEAFPERLSFPAWFDHLADGGRLGSKRQHGLYLYEKGRRTKPDPAVYEIAGAARMGSIPDRGSVPDRVFLPMLDEAALCLEEGLVEGAGDLDLAMILGTGFPPFRGGPCRWADQQGVDSLAREMERLASSVHERFAPSESFLRVVEAGGFYSRFPG
jgi:3-hydroxyacyl-CoA dehydrogenase/enoyl-CoA hydratase/3-hydroxybutyryl-CoA epimerase